MPVGKKLFSIFIAIAMVLGLMVPAFAAPVPSDAIGTDYEDAARRLAQFDIMIGDDTGSFQGARTITRAEMARIVVSMQNLNEAATISAGPTPFNDVPAIHWASGFINVAYNAGMIIGTSATTFEPDRHVTYQEAITMIVRAVGYVNLAGNWPVNYINRAAQIGITQGMSVTGTEFGTRGNIAIMVNNSLDANPLKISKVDSDGNAVEYEVEEDKTVLTKYFNLDEVTGIILFTHDEDPDNIDENRVRILVGSSEIIYKLGNMDLSEHLGKEVVFYTSKNETPATVMGIKEVKTSSDKVIVPKSFSNASESSGVYTINYTDSSDNDKTLTGQTTVRSVFNGKATDFDTIYNTLENSTVNNVLAQEPTGRIVRTSDASAYLIINTWTEPAVITNINTTAETITVQDTGVSGSALLELEDNVVSISLNDNIVSLDALEEDDVVEILKSTDGEKISIHATRETIIGKVEALAYAGASEIERVRINGTYYTLNDNARAIVGNVSIGSDVRALLDKDGLVEKLSADSAIAGNYAVALVVEEQEFFAGFGNMRDPAKVQLLLADGTKKVFDAVEGLRVHKQDGTLSTALINDGGSWTPVDRDNIPTTNDANIANALIKYETNSSGLLSRVSLIPSSSLQNLSVSGYTKDSVKMGNDNMTANTLIFNVYDNTAKVYKYTDLDDISGTITGYKVYVANTNFNELEVLYITNRAIDAATSDYNVAMVITRSDLGDDIVSFTLNDGNQVFTLENDPDVSVDLSAAFPRTLIKYRVNNAGKIIEVTTPDADEILIGGSASANNLVSHINANLGFISVNDAAYTEYVGTSPVIYDISDYHESSTVPSGSRSIRTLSLNQIVTGKMYVNVFRIKIDDTDRYFVTVTKRDN